MKMRLDTKKIYLAMAERGLTVTEIAKRGSVSQQAVSNALNGNRIGSTPSCKLLKKLGFKCISTEYLSFNEDFSFEGGNFILNLQ